MKTNLTDYVTQLQAADTNLQIGLFYDRLQATLNSMSELTTFVSDTTTLCFDGILHASSRKAMA